jgi:hypothetical protein
LHLLIYLLPDHSQGRSLLIELRDEGIQLGRVCSDELRHNAPPKPMIVPMR